ncbi:MAG TPA: MMPL family transporter, partial [Thermoanaerobaculia bacterium]|nr:MMPL family transporter [Thermoanaerobaculia bacterium]
MTPLTRAALRRPLLTLASALLLTLAAAPGLLRLELRTDGQALVPRDHPAVVYDRQIRDELGVRDPIAVVVRTAHRDGIWNAATLQRVRDLTAALAGIDGVRPADVTSLATEHTFRFRPRSLQLRTFLEPLPATREAISEARDDLRRIGLYDGVLVSADGRATALLVGVPPGAGRAAFLRQVHETAARLAGRDTVEVLGGPVAEALLGSHILADLGVPDAWLEDGGGEVSTHRRVGLVPAVLAVMGLVFFAAFRRGFAAVVPLVTIAVSLVTTFGLMGWLGVPVYLTTTVLPVILAAVGVTDQVHIYHRYAELRRERPELDAASLAGLTLEEMTWPVVQTWVTTAVGFLSFAVSPLPPVQAFGLFAALGVLICLSWSLTVVPALLVLLRPALRSSLGRSGGGFAALARFAVRHRRPVLAAAALLALVSLDGVRRLAVQDSWVDGFAPDSGFARAMRRFDREFLGSHLLLVTVEAEPLRFGGEIAGAAVGDHSLTLPAAQVPPLPAEELSRLAGTWVEVAQRPAPDRPRPRDWDGWVETARRERGQVVLTFPLQEGSPRFWLRPEPGERLDLAVRREPFVLPETLRQTAGLEDFLASRPGVGGVLGPGRYLSTIGFMLDPDRPAARSLPDSPDLARSFWSHYRRVRGPERLGQLVDSGYTKTLVTVFLDGSNYAATARLMDELRGYERRLAPHGLRLGFAGDVAVSQAMIGAIVTTQVRSLALSLAGILVLIALLGRSWRRGLLAVLPPAFAVLVSFAAMGWLDIPLGVATSMFAGMTLGVGVDYVVHLLERHRRARAAGLAGEAAVADALAATGPAITVDTLAVGMAFSVLLLSQVPANARLGGLLALSLFVCLAATLAVIPALLAP